MIKQSFLLACIIGVFCGLFNPLPASAQLDSRTEMVTLTSPTHNQLNVMKHLYIQANFSHPVITDSLVILLDDCDISALLTINEQGLQGVLPMLLTSGEHTLYISGNSTTDSFVESFPFSSRQYAGLDEAYSTNEWDTTVQTGRFHSNQSKNFSFSSLDATLDHQSTVKLGNWRANLFANARQLGEDSSDDTEAMNHGSIDPEHRGLDLNSILFQLQYHSEKTSAIFEVGDLQVEGTRNTFETLARNGAQLSCDLFNFYLRGFSVYSKETFGLHDGIGVGFDDDKFLYGVTGGYHFWEDRFDLSVFYLNGGQQQNSYSSWSQEEGNQGNLYGVQLTSNLWDGLLTGEFEYDRSDYDPYTSDEFGSSTDNAWRLQLGGGQESCSYNFCYEYFGPDYNLPGDLTNRRDYAGFTGGGSILYNVHTLGISFASYNDNVDSDKLYARTNSYYGQISYSYSGFAQYPLSLSYRHTRDRSSDEPEYSPETDLKTDILEFNASYSGIGIFAAAMAASYSWQDDTSERDDDTTTFSLALSPSWTFEQIQLCLNGTLNQNRDLHADTRTDDYMFTLDASGSLLNERIGYDFGGSYNYTTVNSDGGDRHYFSGYSRFNYHLPWLVKLAHPVLGVEFQYNVDKPENESRTRESRMLCTLSTTVPSIF